MIKIGCDIVEISRIEKSIQNEHFLKSIFTENEIAYCKEAKNFAGIFAAKEACLKAIGTGINIRMNKLEILHNKNGKPYTEFFKDKYIFDLSISHDGNTAMAVACAEEIE